MKLKDTTSFFRCRKAKIHKPTTLVVTLNKNCQQTFFICRNFTLNRSCQVNFHPREEARSKTQSRGNECCNFRKVLEECCRIFNNYSTKLLDMKSQITTELVVIISYSTNLIVLVKTQTKSNPTNQLFLFDNDCSATLKGQ